MKWSILSVSVMVLGSLPRLASAQQVPFFGGGVVAYDPEVSIIQSGAMMDAQATVSDDHKYVTIGMRATNSRLQSLQSFPVSTINNQGFVGGANLAGATAAPASPVVTSGVGGASAAASAARTNLVNPSPEQIQREARGWILARQGMYLVKPLP